MSRLWYDDISFPLYGTGDKLIALPVWDSLDLMPTSPLQLIAVACFTLIQGVLHSSTAAIGRLQGPHNMVGA